MEERKDKREDRRKRGKTIERKDGREERKEARERVPSPERH